MLCKCGIIIVILKIYLMFIKTGVKLHWSVKYNYSAARENYLADTAVCKFGFLHLLLFIYFENPA